MKQNLQLDNVTLDTYKKKLYFAKNYPPKFVCFIEKKNKVIPKQ